jgi:F0F1-type ATP synthase membrane subunit b/b'
MKKLATLLLAGAIAITAASAIARAQEKQPEDAAERAAEPGAGEHGELEGWKWANFAVLAAGLGYLAKKHGGPFFDARSQQIRKDLTDAEFTRKEAQERADAVMRRIANLESEIAALRQQSKTEAEAEATRIAQHTEAEIAKIRAHTESEIASAGKAARTDLKRYSAQLAVKLAEQKVRSRMNPQSQEALVRGFVHDLANPAPRSTAN